MCGIAGILDGSPAEAVEARLRAAIQAMSHRGPDGEGLRTFKTPSGSLALGHKRLAILDLSDAGLQPMADASGNLHITYNGEIYNYIELRDELVTLGHRFHTSCDTEVLLASWRQWGQACLTRLDGMFAFVIHDVAAQMLFGARDAFGIKPFFYSWTGRQFAFASETGTLLETGVPGRSVDLQRAHSFLAWGEYDTDDRSFFADIRQLPPGHLLTMDLSGSVPGKPQVSCWSELPVVPEMPISLDDAAEQFRDLFLRSVRRQLRSDVPRGITLSGGLDSSTLACAVRHLEPDFPIRTFSYRASGARYDESAWAQKIIDHVGAQAHWIDDRNIDPVTELDDAIRAHGEPFGSTSILAGYRVMRTVREQGVTVTLDGQGADELLAGYDGYPAAALRSWAERRGPVAMAMFANRWRQHPGRDLRGLILHAGDAFLPQSLRRGALSLIGHDAFPAWMNRDAFEAAGGAPTLPLVMKTSDEARGRRLAERLRSALQVSRLPALLRHGDRNSMRFSIESRVPFLAPDLARFLLRLPEEYLLSPEGQTKFIMRRALHGIVPDEVLERKDKIGFETPERQILAQNRVWVDECLEAADRIAFLNAAEVRKLVHDSISSDGRLSFKAWRMINYCRWYDMMGCK